MRVQLSFCDSGHVVCPIDSRKSEGIHHAFSICPVLDLQDPGRPHLARQFKGFKSTNQQNRRLYAGFTDQARQAACVGSHAEGPRLIQPYVLSNISPKITPRFDGIHPYSRKPPILRRGSKLRRLDGGK